MGIAILDTTFIELVGKLYGVITSNLVTDGPHESIHVVSNIDIARHVSFLIWVTLVFLVPEISLITLFLLRRDVGIKIIIGFTLALGLPILGYDINIDIVVNHLLTTFDSFVRSQLLKYLFIIFV